MAAPFPLPDTAAIYNWDYSVTKYENVPCRQVPRFKEVFYGLTGGVNAQKYGYTHWVDFEVGLTLVREMTYAGALSQQANDFTGDIIEFDFDGVMLRLRIEWIEYRFTHTENEYMRVYCNQISLAEM